MSRSATTQRAARRGLLDLARGHPSDDLLPLTAVRRAAASRLAGDDASPLQYGAERGDGGFRRRLADFLARQTGERPDPERLLVTAGASQALDLACSLLTRHGDVVLVEEPSYHLALSVFRDHGLEAVGVAGDANGMRPEALEAVLAEDRRAARAKLLYLVPAFGNPSGACLAPDRYPRIVETALRHGVQVVSDEVYRLLAFDGAPPPGLGTHAGDAVLSLQSFSKILAPGLRLGWIEAPEPLLDRIERGGLLQSGGGLAPLTAAIVGELLEGGVADAHLARLRHVYRERAAALEAALRHAIPEAELATPRGGYFLWARVPDLDAEASLPVAEAAGVSFAPGPRFSSRGGSTDRIRLSFAHHARESLREAAHRLARALAQARALQSGRRAPAVDAPGVAAPQEEP